MNPDVIDFTLTFSDEEFDAAYPIKMQKLSPRHWTPVHVARRAAGFLVQKNGTRVLDIGSGAGKFCLVGAASSSGHFTGVEQREVLVRLSKKMAKKHQVMRADFVHANILAIDLNEYEGFYFFNSFEENLDLTERIDKEVQYSISQYHGYCRYLHDQFDRLRQGTRIVTYCSPTEIIPDSYVQVKSEIKGKLKFWEKRY